MSKDKNKELSKQLQDKLVSEREAKNQQYEKELRKKIEAEIAAKKSISEVQDEEFIEVPEVELTEEEKAEIEEEIRLEKIRIEIKNEQISTLLKDFDEEIDINQSFAAWGLKIIQDQYLGTETDLEKLRDTLNKISECNVAIFNYFKEPTDYNREMIRTTLLNWTKKESTNIDFKAKYR